MDSHGIVCCARCKRFFVPRFRFQSVEAQGDTTHYCSQTCREPALMGRAVDCSACNQTFAPTLAAHVQHGPDGRHRYFCGAECRSAATGVAPLKAPIELPPHEDDPSPFFFGPPAPAPVVVEKAAPKAAAPLDSAEPRPGPFERQSLSAPVAEPPGPFRSPRRTLSPRTPTRIFAVLNQKGGTAKTTTAVSVAAGFAALGHRTLLMDLDPQGNVAVALGVHHPRTISHLLTQKSSFANCVTSARPLLDVVLADESLALTEQVLARSDAKERRTRLLKEMAEIKGYDYVVLDCAPAQSLVNENALFYAGEVLIPVSCDYLALVGVKQVLRTLRRVGERTGKTIRVAGVLPTFYDVRNMLSLESLGYLRKTFGPRLLPPIRSNTKLAEAPSKHATIFEYATESHGARDYMRVVEWLRSSRKAGQAGYVAA